MYLASLHIKDPFYIVPIYEPYSKLLKPLLLTLSYKFNSMPNGYINPMRVFTNSLKPSFCYLREQVYSSVIYVDDTLLVGDTYAECNDNIWQH